VNKSEATIYCIAPKGEPAPASGWLSDWRFDTEGLTAAVEWTPIGTELFSKKAYRYLSPALLHDGVGGKNDTTMGNVIGLHSVALTNDPNLDLPALNSRENPVNEAQLKALGLAADATEEQIMARIAELDAAGKVAKPDALVTEMKAGFAALLEGVKELIKPAAVAPNASKDAHQIAVNAVLDSAVAAGHDEAIGIVISRGSRAEAEPRFSAYVWAPAPEPEPDSTTRAA